MKLEKPARRCAHTSRRIARDMRRYARPLRSTSKYDLQRRVPRHVHVGQCMGRPNTPQLCMSPPHALLNSVLLLLPILTHIEWRRWSQALWRVLLDNVACLCIDSGSKSKRASDDQNVPLAPGYVCQADHDSQSRAIRFVTHPL